MHDEQSFEEMYRATDALWSGRPNTQLVAEAADLPPGTALDVGCGEGADAMWLAARGWQVTAVDFAATALERAAAHAAAAGEEVAAPHRVGARRRDPVDAGAGRLRPRLRTVHAPADGASAARCSPGWRTPSRPGVSCCWSATTSATSRPGRTGRRSPRGSSPRPEVAAALDPDAWEVLVAEARPRPGRACTRATTSTVRDAVLRARRRDVMRETNPTNAVALGVG